MGNQISYNHNDLTKVEHVDDKDPNLNRTYWNS